MNWPSWQRHCKQPPGKNFRVIFDRNFADLRNSIADVENAISQFKTAGSKLGADFAQEDLVRIPVDQLDIDWRQASASAWPKSLLGKRRVRKLLQSYVRSGKADPERDLPHLRIMKASAEAVGASSLGSHAPGWCGVESDTAAISTYFDEAAALRSALMRLGQAAGSVKSVAQSGGALPDGRQC